MTDDALERLITNLQINTRIATNRLVAGDGISVAMLREIRIACGKIETEAKARDLTHLHY